MQSDRCIMIQYDILVATASEQSSIPRYVGLAKQLQSQAGSAACQLVSHIPQSAVNHKATAR